MNIEKEIKQSRPFENEYIKANVNILYTASWINHHTSQIVKPYGISWQQFNVLRILKGVYPGPSTVKELTEKMIDRTSNASRLVDKLLEKNLADRKECPDDRRKVEVFITPKGLEVCDEVSLGVESRITDLFSTIDTAEASTLNHILDKMRG